MRSGTSSPRIETEATADRLERNSPNLTPEDTEAFAQARRERDAVSADRIKNRGDRAKSTAERGAASDERDAAGSERDQTTDDRDDRGRDRQAREDERT